jgi:hypothetical protein
MDDFSFYLSYYGLILGLSVAAVASGFVDAFSARHRIKMGWLTPALALFILTDITSFWIYAWGIRKSITINWLTMYVGLLIAVVYYVAAGLVFPRHASEWPDLDQHYWKHKRLVIGGIIIPNVISTSQAFILHPPVIDRFFIFNEGNYWPPVVLLLFSRRSWQDLLLLSILILGYFATPFIPSWIV